MLLSGVMPRVAPITGMLSAVTIALAVACGGDYAEESSPPKDAGADDAPVDVVGSSTTDAADAAEVRTPVTPLSFVTRKIYLGDTDRNGVDDPNAWQKYGRDIDGISIGLGFEMTRVVIGTAAQPVQPPANPCP